MKISAKKLPSGSYRVQVYAGMIEGKRIYKSFTDPSKDKAELEAAEYIINHNNTIVTDMTVSQAMSAYIAERTHVISPTTLQSYRLIQKYYYKRIKDKRITDITCDDIQIATNELAASLSAKSVRNAHGLLSAVLHAYRPKLAINTRLPQDNTYKGKCPSDAEVKAIVQYSEGEPIHIAILLAAFCGLRRGEISALCYEDIDYQSKMLHVQKSQIYVDKQVRVKVPKNSFDRYVPVPQFVLDKIGTGAGRIMTISLNAIHPRFVRICEKLEIKCRFHDLRHYYASKLHSIGVPDLYILKSGGWRSDHVMKRIYRNSMDDAQKKFTGITANAFNDVITDKK